MKYILPLFVFLVISCDNSPSCSCADIENKIWYYASVDRDFAGRSNCYLIDDFTLRDGQIDIFRSGTDGGNVVLEYVELENIGRYTFDDDCILNIESIDEDLFFSDQASCSNNGLHFTLFNGRFDQHRIDIVDCNTIVVNSLVLVDTRP